MQPPLASRLGCVSEITGGVLSVRPQATRSLGFNSLHPCLLLSQGKAGNYSTCIARMLLVTLVPSSCSNSKLSEARLFKVRFITCFL